MGSSPEAPDGYRPSNYRRAIYQKWWAWGVIGIGFGVTGIVVAGVEAIDVVKHDLPNTTRVLTYVRSGSLTIKTEDGTILQQLGPVTRDKVSLDDMPTRLPEAFIASEDQEFYNHHGINYQAVARAFLTNLMSGQVREGASTITQQLARIVFLTQERNIGRKVREALLAEKMEDELSKKQILESYLNLVYLGSNAYGVADAAWIYFSKPVEKLTLGEIAMIAGMAPAPSVYSPLVNPDLAKRRRNIVLERMAHVGFITPAERDQAIAQPLTVKPSNPKYIASEAPYFTSYIQQELPNLVSPEEMEMGGLTVETTLNLKWQKLAQETVKHAISSYGPYEDFGQAALVAVDPRDGEIKVLVGGDDYGKSQFNRATQAQRQPGSTFKAFVYSTAIAAGFSPYKTYVDAKYVVDGYEPHNYSKSYRGTVTMRDAIASSINIIAVKTLVDVGFDPVIEMAKRMGIKSKLLPTYSLALGTSEVNLLELTGAYGTLANKGEHVETHGITRIYDRFGKIIYDADFKPERAIDEASASIMSWLLEGVVYNGTGGAAALPDRQVAGKTGTSEKRRDLWFVGYIPQLVTGVWLGNDDSSPTAGASSTAAQTWRDFMADAVHDIPVEDFPKLPDLNTHDATIKAKPVHPGKVYAANVPDNSQSDWRSDDNYSSGDSWSPPEESYSSGSSYSEPAPAESHSSESSGSAESAPADSSAPEASTSNSATTAEPAPPAPPEPAPAAESAPPPIPSSNPISEPPPLTAPIEPAPPPAPATGAASGSSSKP
jgi:penicillin-binding protein 1A